MPAPAFITTTADTWEPVALNVIDGQVHRITSGRTYLQTYRPQGEAAPTLRTEGIPAFLGGAPERILSNEPIDVYIWTDDNDGEVRVDV